ncbi:MAG: tannase/feruloyl esterase family alpha/beta hydrolase, partial [Pseudomonadota bacterium]|nr:tannase/feruloyl esterase family alpha/beta hydrolase [Pseudomonadota bacterium]
MSRVFLNRLFLSRLVLSQLAAVTFLLGSRTLAAEDLTGFCNAIKHAVPEDGVVSHIETKAQHCRVTTQVRPATLSRSADSFIEVYTWLPAPDKWNGRFIAFGNGGYSDSIAQSAMTAYLNKGFAVGATNTGHRGDDLSFASDVPERIDYWGRYAVHALSETGKTLIEQAYGDAPQFSYFSGCSTGGHQALASVQYFPQDFDGVLAGAPGNNRVALNAA